MMAILNPPLSSTSADTPSEVDRLVETLMLMETMPDKDQLLVEQNLQAPLDTFTCFPRLPFDLREIIWKLHVPSRRVVHIAALVGLQWNLGNDYHPGLLPILFKLNQESREVIQKSHTMLKALTYSFKSRREGEGARTRKSFCVSPRNDMIYLIFLDAMIYSYSKYFRNLWKPHLESLSLIETLTIRRVAWFKNNAYSTPWYKKNGILQHFTGLKELILIPNRKYEIHQDGWQGSLNNESKMDCVQRLLKFFANLAARNSGSTIPCLILKSWRRLEVRTEDEYRNDGLWERWEWKQLDTEDDEDAEETWGPVLVEDGKPNEDINHDDDGISDSEDDIDVE